MKADIPKIGWAKCIPTEDNIKLDSLIIKARDNTGHGEQIGCTIPMYMRDAMLAIVHDESSPWKDAGYVTRAAIKLFLNFWANVSAEFKASGEYAMMEATAAIIEEEEKSEHFNSILGSLHETLSVAISRGPEGEKRARQLLLKILNFVRSAPPSYYRTQYIKTIKQKYGDLLAKYGIDWSWEMRAPVSIGDIEGE